jgi:glycosyltransferase involved in cell wall biosynthesis
MKKVLMIVYNYPPSGRAGTYRSLRFSKYLPHEGWKPIVLSVKENKYDAFDYSLLNNIPSSVEIYRTPAFLFYKRYLQIIKPVKCILYKLFDIKKEIKNNAIEKTDINRGGTNNKGDNNGSRMVWRYLPGDILRTPDKAVGWMPFAFFAGLFLIYKKQPNIIYATGRPFTSFISGMCLKKITGIPLIVDFRDLWADSFSRKSHPFFTKLTWYLENKVLSNADKVIANTPDIKKKFISNHHINEKNIIVINNGFDKEDFQNLVPSPYNKFTIAYVGSLYSRSHNPDPFFLALRELLDEDKALEKEIQIVIAGAGLENYLETIDKLGLKNIIRWEKLVEHKIALKIMASAHLLLVLQNGTSPESSSVPGKIYEYLATRKPIMAIGSGALRDFFISEKIYGEVIDQDSISKIKKAIHKFHVQYRAGKLKTQPKRLLEKYNSQSLTKILAEVLNSHSSNLD